MLWERAYSPRPWPYTPNPHWFPAWLHLSGCWIVASLRVLPLHRRQGAQIVYAEAGACIGQLNYTKTRAPAASFPASTRAHPFDHAGRMKEASSPTASTRLPMRITSRPRTSAPPTAVRAPNEARTGSLPMLIGDRKGRLAVGAE